MILSMVVVVVMMMMMMMTMVMTVMKLMLVAGIPWPQSEPLNSHIRHILHKGKPGNSMRKSD
jgi:hypothetical protein